ncbi:MAG: hypothetical protein GC138_04745 [Gammaproteobacteria bacterium]|nr:hypothetical protein [Gammaproteobacteria bacterium]
MRAVVWRRMGAIVCLCASANVACSRQAVQPYMQSRMTEPMVVPEGLSAPRASHEMDVPEAILSRIPDEDLPRSGDGEALPPGLKESNK